MSNPTRRKFDPLGHRIVGPLMVIGLLAGLFFSAIAFFYLAKQ